MIGVFPVILNFDLLSVGVIVGAIIILGAILLFSDKKSTVGKIFFFLSVAISIWSISNYLSYRVTGTTLTTWTIRLVFFSATYFAYFLFLFAHVFPDRKLQISKSMLYAATAATGTLSVLTLTPYLISNTELSGEGTATGVKTSWAIIPFAVIVMYFLFSSVILLIKNTRKARGEEIKQFKLVGLGFGATFSLLILFNFIFPAFFSISYFIPFGAFFVFPFVLFTFYAIYKHKLFNIKVVGTGLVTILFAIAIFLQIIYAVSVSQMIFQSTIFILVVMSGILLIKGVLKEIEAREEIDKLAKKLAATNWELSRSNEQLRIIDQRKSEFVSIASHQLRTPVTAIKGYSSLLLEDSFGKISDEVKDPIRKIFLSSQRLVEMINDFLNVSKIEQGTMSYTLAPIDLKKMANDVVQDFHVAAGEKKIDLETIIPENSEFHVNADEGKVRQILSNVIDNAIKYTPKGSVRVSLEKDEQRGEGGLILLKIKDTGIGLSHDDLTHLFGKFTRGSEGSKVNTSGSGLGLYVAKKMLEAMKGNIWVDSEGPGKGSVFCIELPEYHGEMPQ